MTKIVRAFKADFAALMTAEEAWPFGNQFVSWMRDNDRPVRNSEYQRIRERATVAEKHLIGFLSYVLAPGFDNEDRKECERRRKAAHCIARFLSGIRVPNPQELEPAQLLEHLCDSAQADESDQQENVFFDGLDGLQRMLNTRRRAYRHIHGCQNEDELREGARWFFADAGNWGRKSPLAPADAIAKVESRFKTSVEDYARFLMACHRRYPWTTVLARGEEKLTGASVVLPLRESVYDQVRAGKVITQDIDPDALAVPSRYLLIEALAHRPESMGGEPKQRATSSMRWCIFAQMATLSQFAFSSKDNRPLHLLSIEGAPDAQKSLLSYGFKPTGTRMAVSGEDLYERTFSPYPIGRDMWFVTILTMLGRDIDGPPPP